MVGRKSLLDSQLPDYVHSLQNENTLGQGQMPVSCSIRSSLVVCVLFTERLKLPELEGGFQAAGSLILFFFRFLIFFYFL